MAVTAVDRICSELIVKRKLFLKIIGKRDEDLRIKLGN